MAKLYLDFDGLNSFFEGLKNLFANKSHSHTCLDISDLDLPDKLSELENDCGFEKTIESDEEPTESCDSWLRKYE